MPKRDSKIERDIKNGNAEYINSITSEKEARRVSEYLIARRAQNSRKIVKLGSKEAVHKEQKTAQERKKIIKAELAMRDKMKQFSKKQRPLQHCSINGQQQPMIEQENEGKKILKDGFLEAVNNGRTWNAEI